MIMKITRYKRKRVCLNTAVGSMSEIRAIGLLLFETFYQTSER